jgi:hypothetical protein
VVTHKKFTLRPKLWKPWCAASYRRRPLQPLPMHLGLRLHLRPPKPLRPSLSKLMQ